MGITIIFTIPAKSDVLLKDIGIIGLASHDMFAWDRNSETNTENGRLDLSTIFDYEKGARWEKGGNTKNAENAPVWTITKKLVKFYKKQLKKMKKDEARLKTVAKFHEMIKDSFMRLSGHPFPTMAINQPVNNTEQAAMRALHDILPGRIKLYRGKFNPRKKLKLTNFLTAKTKLNQKELNQKIKYFDGDYDKEYKSIKIPFSKKRINLKAVDGKFIEKFSPYKHQEMLAELAMVGKKEKDLKDVSFIHHIQDLFAKGVCQTDNKWIQNDIPCE